MARACKDARWCTALRAATRLDKWKNIERNSYRPADNVACERAGKWRARCRNANIRSSKSACMPSQQHLTQGHSSRSSLCARRQAANVPS
eukprot:15375735-Alexandrium_andersonii.AAC.1